MNLIHIVNDDYALITIVDPDHNDMIVREIETTGLREGQCVRIDDGKQLPQLCVGGGLSGNTIVYESPEQLARVCKARLYKTLSGYKRAKNALDEF